MSAMTQAERQRVTEYLAETQARVLLIVQDLSAQQLDFKSKPARWSISQTLEHLSAVDNLTRTLIEEALGKPAGLKGSAWKDRDDALLDQVRNRVLALKAPEMIQPSEATDHDDVFRRLKEARQRLLAFAASTDAPLRSFCVAHPVFGELDCYQWLLAMGAHFELHLGQIHEVIELHDLLLSLSGGA
jgi:DinB superfamily